MEIEDIEFLPSNIKNMILDKKCELEHRVLLTKCLVPQPTTTLLLGKPIGTRIPYILPHFVGGWPNRGVVNARGHQVALFREGYFNHPGEFSSGHMVNYDEIVV